MLKKTLKSISLLIVLTLVAAMVFAGCGSNSNQDAGTTGKADTSQADTAKEEPEKDPVSIIYSSFRAEDEAIFKKMIEKFEGENPDVKVQLDLNKDTSAYYNTLKANFASGEDLDVYDVHPGPDFVRFATEGYMEDLSSLDFVKNYSDAAKLLTTIDGKILGYNQAVNLELCIYNKEIFKKYGVDVPKDFNDLVDIVNKMKAGGEGGIAYPGGDVKAQWMFNATINVEAGAEGFKSFFEGVDSGSILTVKDNAGVYAGLKALEAINKANILYDNSVSVKYPQALSLFAQGKAPIVYMGTWTFGTADTDFPGIDYGIFALPTPNKSNIAFAEPAQISCIYTQSKNIEAAKKWINFMAAPENASIYINAAKMTPTIKGVKAEFKGAEMLSEQMEKGVVILPMAKQVNTDSYDAAFKSMAENILFKGADVDKEISAFEEVLKKADLKNRK